MMVSDHDLERLAEHVSRATVAALEERDKNKSEHCEMCMTEDRRREHRQDHEFIRSLMSALDRIENVKWGIVSGVLQTILAAAIIGLCVFVYKYGIRN